MNGDEVLLLPHRPRARVHVSLPPDVPERRGPSRQQLADAIEAAIEAERRYNRTALWLAILMLTLIAAQVAVLVHTWPVAA